MPSTGTWEVGAGLRLGGKSTRLIVFVIQAQAAVQGLQQLACGVLLPGGAGYSHAGTVNFFGLIFLTKLL